MKGLWRPVPGLPRVPPAREKGSWAMVYNNGETRIESMSLKS